MLDNSFSIIVFKMVSMYYYNKKNPNPATKVFNNPFVGRVFSGSWPMVKDELSYQIILENKRESIWIEKKAN